MGLPPDEKAKRCNSNEVAALSQRPACETEKDTTRLGGGSSDAFSAVAPAFAASGTHDPATGFAVIHARTEQGGAQLDEALHTRYRQNGRLGS